MPLERRRLGRSNVEVTTLGLGGGPIGKGGAAGTLDAAGTARLVRAAYDGGVRYFDTAPLYGHGMSERLVGGALRALPRDEVVLSTKVGRIVVPAAEAGGGPQSVGPQGLGVRYDYSYAGARASLEESLQRLGLDRVDVLLCHDIDAWTHGEAQPAIYEQAAEGILRALADLRREGAIRAFGIGVNEWQVSSRVVDEFDVDCVLLAGRFTLLEQSPLDGFLPKCAAKGVSVIIGGPYNSGLLAVSDRAAATYDYRPVDDERWGKAQAIRAVCDRHGVDMRAAALQYPLRHPAVAAVIPGAASLEELRANLGFATAPVPAALWTALEGEGLVRPL
ncbi:MAG: aldo/keto reductase [Chloroflexi bacterium]|nr:aldo/keto reductase [Chloroflexota bacterium]